MMPFHDEIFLKICGRLLKGNISKPVNPAYFLEHTVNIYVCQTDPYYSNYNTFHIIAILEVKKMQHSRELCWKANGCQNH